MATFEKDGQMTYVDDAGNEHLLFPKTNIGRVIGLEEALASKAPAGYGLGGIGHDCVDCNEVIASGFYSLMGSSLVNGPGSDLPYGNMLVLNRHNNHITQVVFRGNIMALRYCIDGTWGEWEWVNPPMVSGVEYRTTKRYNGKPVYTKLVKHTFTATTGNANGVTTFAINGGCSVVADIVSLSAVFVGSSGDKYIIPTMGGNGNVWLGVNRVSSGNLYTVFVIVNDVFSTGSHGEVIYEYTKTTD